MIQIPSHVSLKPQWLWLRKHAKFVLITIIIILAVVVVVLTIILLSSKPSEQHTNIFCLRKSQQGNASTNNKVFVLILTPGDRSIYERKASISYVFPPGDKKEIGWGDNVVPIFGNITDIPPSNTNLGNKIIFIQAYQNGQLIYQRYVKTDWCGNFNSFFYPPESGDVKITAKMLGSNVTSVATTEGIITVTVTESWIPIIVIITLVVASIAIIGGFRHVYQNDNTKLRMGVIPALIPVAFAYFFLYKYPPFDAVGNVAIAGALITPIIAYVFQIIKNEQRQSASSSTRTTSGIGIG
jgi:hypothetical protein